MNVALIPARGGSKSIPKKNIKILNGKPLIYWTIKAAVECKYIDCVYVNIDSVYIIVILCLICNMCLVCASKRFLYC